MGININNLLDRLENVSELKEEMNEKLTEIKVEGEAGGGLVRVRLNGQKKIDDISIDDSLMNVESKKILCDLIIAASHVAHDNVEEKIEEISMQASMDILPELFD